MNTWELEANLRSLDARTKQLGDGIIRMRNEYAGCRQLEAEHRKKADDLYYQARNNSDEEQSRQLTLQASVQEKEAKKYGNIASGIEMELTAMEGELWELRAAYGSYLEEGKRNIGSLSVAAEKLLGASTSRYGGGSVQTALQETRRRITYNDNLVKGCQRRIAWIEQICGSGGTPKVYTYKMR